MTGTKRVMGSAFLLLALAGAGYVIWLRSTGQEGKTVPKDKPPVPVLVAMADVRDMPVILDLVGRAEAYESVHLKARVDGQVATVAFQEGQAVAAGQELLRLDEADFSARLRQAEANLARDQANLSKARADVGRYTTLQAQGFVSSEKVDEVAAVLAAAEATVKADQAAVELARLQRSYTVIRAPFAGLVGARLVHPGTTVKMNETELAVVNRVQPLYVSFAVPEKYLPRLRSRLGTGTLGVSVRIPGETGTGLRAEPQFLDHAVDTASGTVRMKALLANPDGHLTPGQFLDVRLVLDTLRGVVTVPAEAVQQGPEGNFVYVVEADQGTRQQPVTLSLTRDGRAALGEGLAAGQTVVIDGHSRLSPQARVRIRDDNAAPARP
ncbi:MAG TPA: efflux RND transporter periplasmic adaptor subunit [Thiobacillaceae bacterium]|nr:efflux RND transporter periplasmic adaptor subunit [Thiobacillaceae bacterium]HNU63155.1 efflux RND transporter periplasmic adaptor subunit [Thiobacillaceae bacterium]